MSDRSRRRTATLLTFSLGSALLACSGASDDGSVAGGAAALSASTSSADSFETHCTYKGKFYFVATNGSDSAPGTKERPFATLTHAASVARPGDTVRIRGNGGTYSPTSQPSIGSVGTASDWICFEGEPGEPAPVFDGSRMEGESTDGIFLDGRYLVLQNVVVENAKKHGIEIGAGGHFVDVVGALVRSSQWAGITIGPGTGDTTATTDVRVHGNEVTNNGLAGIPGGGSFDNWPAIVRSFGASNVSFTENFVHQNFGEGIDFILTHGGEALANVSWDNYSSDFYLDNADGITVSRNFAYWTGDLRFRRKDTGLGPVGVQMAEENEYGASIKLSRLVVTNNVTVGVSMGLYYGSYRLNLGLEDSVIAGNTFVVGTGGRALAIDGSSGHAANRLVDNIFVGGDADWPNTSAFDLSHNLYFEVPNAPEEKGAGNVLADPQFTDRGAFYVSAYQLRASSPAWHAGTGDPALTEDFATTTRPDVPAIGAWDAK